MPFQFQAIGGVGRLALTDLAIGPIIVDRLELEISELGTDPGASAAAARFQRRRTQLRGLAVRITQPALDDRVALLARPLAGLGFTQLAARLHDGYVAVRARTADGLAAADLTFHIELVSAGAQLRALASTIRVHGHLPTPAPVIADRLLGALLGASDDGKSERPGVRGLCDVEVDLVGALLWHVLPPSGWRLPTVSEIELTHIRVARAAIEVAYGPAGTRPGELGVRQPTRQLAAAHDVMHSVDQQLRAGHLDEAMRGYRALLASSGPDQPLLLARMLALAAARPAWFFDGLELARQALGRWPAFAPAHAALASITLAQGDAREAARHLETVARLARADGDDDQAALAALAAARLLRVLDPRAATALYQLALEHDPASAEAADSLADRLTDEQRWPELVRLVRTRAAATADPARAGQLHLQLAGVLVQQLGDLDTARHELARARVLTPDDPAVHEMTASVLGASDPAAAIAAWREVARLAEKRGDHRTGARAWSRLGDLHARTAGAADTPAQDAWQRALALDPLQVDALVGLAGAAAARGDHRASADLYERLRGLGLAQAAAASHELALARSQVVLGRHDDARASLRRAMRVGGEPAAEAHAVLAQIAEATGNRDLAAAELDQAIAALVELADAEPASAARRTTRAAELAAERATLFDRAAQPSAAASEWQRAHALAHASPELARRAARALLAHSAGDAVLERHWIDAVLATDPPPGERAELLVRRAGASSRDGTVDVVSVLAEIRGALELAAASDAGASHDTRRQGYQLEAALFAQLGDLPSRARALAALAALDDDAPAAERARRELAATSAWLAAGDPATALPHGVRARIALDSLPASRHPAGLRREILAALGEAAWRQRAWPDAIDAYRELLDEIGAVEPGESLAPRHRLAVAADRTGDGALALAALRPLVDDASAMRDAGPELRGQVLRLFADLAERTGALVDAALALERFAAIGGDSAATARADALYRAGELLRRAGRGDDAIRCLDTALRIADTHLPALDALETVWRERGDLERVAGVVERKVAATARYPGRQKPLLSRLADLQDQLGLPDRALATHQRALEIDAMWRPSLRYVTLGLRDAGQVVAAAGGLAQLAGDLHGDHGVDLVVVIRERKIAAEALAELVARLDDAQLEAVRAIVEPALERAALDNADVGAGLARLRGETPQSGPTERSEADTETRRRANADAGARALRDTAQAERAAGKLDAAFATLETANQLSPGDPAVLRDLVELATALDDHAAAAHHLAALAHALSGARRGDALLELADLYYDKLDDALRGRDAMRKAADAFGSGARRDATLRLLATEAGTHLAWDIAVEALMSVPSEKRTQADFSSLATALTRAGRDADALATIEAATAAHRFDDGGELVRQLQLEIQRKTNLARALEERAVGAARDEAIALRDEAQQLRIAIGQPGNQPLRDMAAPIDAPRTDTAPWPARTKTRPGLPSLGVAPARRRRTTAPQPFTRLPKPVVAIDDVAEPSSGVPIATHDAPEAIATEAIATEAIATEAIATEASDAVVAARVTATVDRDAVTWPEHAERPSRSVRDEGAASPEAIAASVAMPSDAPTQTQPGHETSVAATMITANPVDFPGGVPSIDAVSDAVSDDAYAAAAVTRDALDSAQPAQPESPSEQGRDDPGSPDAASAHTLTPEAAHVGAPAEGDFGHGAPSTDAVSGDADAAAVVTRDALDSAQPAQPEPPSEHGRDDPGSPDAASADTPAPEVAQMDAPAQTDVAHDAPSVDAVSGEAYAASAVTPYTLDSQPAQPVSTSALNRLEPDAAFADTPAPEVAQMDAPAQTDVAHDAPSVDAVSGEAYAAAAGTPHAFDPTQPAQPDSPSEHGRDERGSSTGAFARPPTEAAEVAASAQTDVAHDAPSVDAVSAEAHAAAAGTLHALDSTQPAQPESPLEHGRDEPGSSTGAFARPPIEAVQMDAPAQTVVAHDAPSVDAMSGEARAASAVTPHAIDSTQPANADRRDHGDGDLHSDAAIASSPAATDADMAFAVQPAVAGEIAPSVDTFSDDAPSIADPKAALPPEQLPADAAPAHAPTGEVPAATTASAAADPPARTATIRGTSALRPPTAPPDSGPARRPTTPTDSNSGSASRRRGFTSPAIGRIKLIPGATTRPGLGALRDDGTDAAGEDDSGGWQSVSNPALTSSRSVAGAADPEPEPAAPSVTITGTPEETALAVMLAAASADRDRLIAARRADPDDPAILLALLAHLGDREPVIRRELLDEVVRTSGGRALAIALHELATLARDNRDPARAAALWTRAHAVDPSYPAVWMPLADALAASDDTHAARELYDAVARSTDYDAGRRAFAADRAHALSRDDSIISGEIRARPLSDLEEAKLLAEGEDWPGAIDAAERAAAARPTDPAVLEVLEKIYLGSGNVTAASEAIGRQLMLADEQARRAALWRRRARMYRDALGRDAEAYRCLKEAHECSPADPEIAHQLRTAAMVRGEWPLAAQLLYREIAAATNPRDRGALHLELALIYEERLDDHPQAQANYEQALAFDPTIPAVKLPLARRYEAIGRWSEAAKLYEDAAATARAADRASLFDAAARCRQAAADAAEPDLAAQLDRAEAAGDLDAAHDLAQQLWRAEPGHPAAFRVLANVHRTSGDLAALTELTRARARAAEAPDERATAWVEVARLAEDIGALDQAARSYDLALIEDPGHIAALDARGALAYRLGDLATADLIYRDLGSGESVLGDDELALRRSIIAEQLGRDSEALDLAQIAASLAPGRRDLMTRVQELATRIGELTIAMGAARHVLELIPLDDDDAQLTTQLALVELQREAGHLDDAVYQLERILRDHPVHAGAIESLAQVHAARGDWPSATRYLYQLVPLAPSPGHRAERLYQLGEAVLVHVNDVDRADDVFLRASDLDPGHVPTLRRLLDVYWRADDPGGIVEVAGELAERDALISGPTSEPALAHALVAAALVGDAQLAHRLQTALGEHAPRQIASALAELAGRTGRLQLATASIAIVELARRGVLDLAKLRAATAGTPAANSL